MGRQPDRGERRLAVADRRGPAAHPSRRMRSPRAPIAMPPSPSSTRASRATRPSLRAARRLRSRAIRISRSDRDRGSRRRRLPTAARRCRTINAHAGPRWPIRPLEHLEPQGRALGQRTASVERLVGRRSGQQLLLQFSRSDDGLGARERQRGMAEGIVQDAIARCRRRVFASSRRRKSRRNGLRLGADAPFLAVSDLARFHRQRSGQCEPAPDRCDFLLGPRDGPDTRPIRADRRSGARVGAGDLRLSASARARSAQPHA